MPTLMTIHFARVQARIPQLLKKRRKHPSCTCLPNEIRDVRLLSKSEFSRNVYGMNHYPHQCLFQAQQRMGRCRGICWYHCRSDSPNSGSLSRCIGHIHLPIIPILRSKGSRRKQSQGESSRRLKNVHVEMTKPALPNSARCSRIPATVALNRRLTTVLTRSA
jgi:hypothetical protein